MKHLTIFFRVVPANSSVKRAGKQAGKPLSLPETASKNMLLMLWRFFQLFRTEQCFLLSHLQWNSGSSSTTRLVVFQKWAENVRQAWKWRRKTLSDSHSKWRGKWAIQFSCTTTPGGKVSGLGVIEKSSKKVSRMYCCYLREGGYEGWSSFGEELSLFWSSLGQIYDGERLSSINYVVEEKQKKNIH